MSVPTKNDKDDHNTAADLVSSGCDPPTMKNRKKNRAALLILLSQVVEAKQ